LSPSLYAGVVAATVLLMLVPGPNVALIVANSLAFGARVGLVTVFGTIVGMIAQLSVAALGVTALFGALAEGFNTLRWLGVVYLLWLGVRDWRTPAGDLSRIAPVSPRRISPAASSFRLPIRSRSFSTGRFCPSSWSPTRRSDGRWRF
jgi:threonine/homoserine/homoserine lactone efflux protein